ncbi:MAG: HAD hydrolase-like protein [Elainellaceae cyanobacterium]
MNTIIFDFDGTIADTFETMLIITNRLAYEFGYQPLTDADVQQLRQMSSREIIRRSQISAFRIPALIRRIKRELQQEIHQLNLIDGMQEALGILRQQDNQLGIVTSNSQDNVQAFLNTHQLIDCFDFIYSGTTIFGKARVIHNLLRRKNILPHTVVYVGDETRDIEAARKIPIKVVAVSWGFNSKEALVQQKPDFLVDYPHDLIPVIAQLSR